jgi:hypothetical protein
MLINTAIQGPPLAFDLGEVSFGAFTATGAAARPYVDLSVEQTWSPREACYGPVRSIFSLAPGETVQLSVSLEQQTSFVETISDHLPDVKAVSISSRFEPHVSASARYPAPKPAVTDTSSDTDGHLPPPDLIAKYAQLLRANQYVGAYGSLWEYVADPLGVHNLLTGGPSAAPLPPTPQGLANGLAKLIGNTVGRNAPAAKESVSSAGHAVTAAGQAAIACFTRDDTTTKTTETTTRQSLTRSFANPYRDRSLQLRFIPLFRRFEVTSTAAQPQIGVALHVGPFRELEAGAINPLARVVADPTHAIIQRPLAQLLGPDGSAATALRWSQAETPG